MMPQLDTTYLFSQIFWLVISFGIFYLCIKQFILPKLEFIINTRANIKSESEGLANKLALEIAQMKIESKRKAEEINILVKNLKSASDTKFDIHSKLLLSKMQEKIDKKLDLVAKEIDEFKKQSASSEAISDIVVESAKKIIFKLTSVNVEDADLRNFIK